ncbi:hypothetical protein BTN98_05065 [Photobacterium aquimaris]|uniref:hypothetical protein n=1 Tax=Photobacterium aquimaris TaxID=512643 RepID=UPI000CF392BC|nr:hypothetical protein [Photobacterium aquimaris]PQJ41023.1 hypothetical protein BTN98_05065 [Photobacterium aquimaris]
MKKVLILHNSTKTAYLFRYNYIKKLIESGHKVKLLSVSDDHLSEEKLKEIGVELVLIRKSRFSLLFFYMKLLSLGRWADVIISHFLAGTMLLSPVLFIFRKKSYSGCRGIRYFRRVKSQISCYHKKHNIFNVS